MEDGGTNEGGWEPGPLDRLGHMLIRAHNGDGLDPFFVVGHPAMPETPDRLVRACFYYAFVMNRKAILLLDNDGRGSMCDMVPDEIVAAWKTPEVLDALGVTYEGLRDGTAVLGDAPLPPPRWKAEDFEPKAGPTP